MIAFVLIPALIGLSVAAAVDDWYDKIHSRKRHPVRHGVSSKQSIIQIMKEEQK